MSDEYTHGHRLSAVESQVNAIQQDVGELKNEFTSVKADVRGLGSILGRIEQGIVQARDEQAQKEAQSRINPIALATVLISIISILVGGAWLIGGNLARQDERSVGIQRQLDEMGAHRGYPSPQQ